MKPIQIFSVVLLSGFLANISVAGKVNAKAEQSIQAMFKAATEIQIEPYNDQLLVITLGPKTLFASSDGKYIFSGPVVDTGSGINLVEQRDNQFRQQRLSKLAPDMYLSFPASTEEQNIITVFTDIDCTYCRRLHTSMPEYNELGITVNYVMLPRAGLNSPSYEKAASVFCSSKPAENMTLAMKGEFDENNSCENTVTNQFELAMEFGINSTPTIILPDGKIKPGFLTPAALQLVLDGD